VFAPTESLPFGGGDKVWLPPKKIEQRFVSAGWDIDNGFPGYLVIGYSGDTLSILARREKVFETANDAFFEILDHTRNVTCWVREIPTPQQAAQLLQEHGEPPQEWDEP